MPNSISSFIFLLEILVVSYKICVDPKVAKQKEPNINGKLKRKLNANIENY